MTASLNKPHDFSALVSHAENIGCEFVGQHLKFTKPEIFMGADGHMFVIDIIATNLKNPTNRIYKTIYLVIGPQLEIVESGEETEVIEVDGVSVHHTLGEFESTIYVPDATCAITYIRLLEKTLGVTIKTMKPCD